MGCKTDSKQNCMSAGAKFRKALEENKPLQILGVINAYCAMMAKRSGAKALYLSGAGVANASLGLPDLGISTLNDVLIDSRRITAACDLPLLVDIDTGFGGAFNIARTIKELIAAGVAAVHMEDQVGLKRCGHRPNKELVSTQEMQDRLKAALDARYDESFVIIARTDAFESQGLDASIERALKYQETGADAIFAEALKDLESYKKFSQALKIPILANITEFGKTPNFNVKELESVGVSMALYPLSAFRAMNKIALSVFEDIITHGDASRSIEKMQTREELYDMLNYYSYEEKLDKLFKEGKK